jgi:hypothetical protein
MDNAMNELWRAQQNAATRAAEGWLELLQPGAKRAPHTPVPPAGVDDPTEAPAGSDTPTENTHEDPTANDLAPEVTAPEVTAPEVTAPEVTARESAALEVLQAIRAIQNLGDVQRDFAEHMTHWAELQRDLADSMTAWATQQRDYADALDRLLAPFSPRA